METFEYFPLHLFLFLPFIERNNEKENEKDHGKDSSSLHFPHSHRLRFNLTSKEELMEQR